MLDRKGLTLVEMLVALVVVLIVFLALMQTALVSIQYNMNNVLRDEAVSIAEERMGNARTIALNSLNSDDDATTPHLLANSDGSAFDVATECPAGWTHGSNGVYVERSLKKIQTFGFCTFRQVTALDNLVPTQTKQVTIDVEWTWKGQAFKHTYTSMVGSGS